jgi:transglutaminase-like putative cysteine protease
LKPREFAFQHCFNYRLTSEPAPAIINAHEDYFGNTVNFITIEGPHRQLAVTSRCEVEVTPRTRLPEDEDPPWEHVRELCWRDTAVYGDGSSEFAFPSPLISHGPQFAEYAGASFTPGRPVLEAGMDLMHRIHQDFQFDAHATTVATPLEQVFHQRRGVCQDFAHLQIACLRALGLPARYVSGYLETSPPPDKPSSSAPTPPMPGSNSGAVRAVGRTWTLPTTSCLVSATLPWRGQGLRRCQPSPRCPGRFRQPSTHRRRRRHSDQGQ